VHIESRNLLDITPRYPELQPLGRALGDRPAILDGEIVALDGKGRPDFGLLQHRMHLASESTIARLAREHAVVYMLFDLLYLDDRSTMALPYQERRGLLEGLGLEAHSWRTPPCHVGAGTEMLESARAHGVEGVVAKKLGSAYEPGRRSGAWLKTKLLRGQEFVVGGWLAAKGRSVVGALLLGYYGGAGGQAKLIYAGKVGTGFSEDDRGMLTRLLRSHARDTSPFQAGEEIPREANWVDPKVVVEVRFLEWTHHDTVRHPSYKGVRDDKDPRQVIREEAGGAR
jgi:bifunctional non-homologous end joining protein LigD